MARRNYVLIGAGGTGSFLFPALIRYLETYQKTSNEEFNVTVIDGKEVSPSKLERQLFFGRFAGSNKALALLEQYGADPKVVIAVPEYLKPEMMHGIRSGDVVLIAADNFPIRAQIEEHAKTLDNITVINGGNEMFDGSLQVYMRRDGTDITPPMSQGHPELLEDDERNPATLSCEQIAELPSGEQTIIANMMSATLMLSGLKAVHAWEQDPFIHRPEHDPEFDPTAPSLPEEVFFNLNAFAMRSTQRPPENP